MSLLVLFVLVYFFSSKHGVTFTIFDSSTYVICDSSRDQIYQAILLEIEGRAVIQLTVLLYSSLDDL